MWVYEIEINPVMSKFIVSNWQLTMTASYALSCAPAIKLLANRKQYMYEL